MPNPTPLEAARADEDAALRRLLAVLDFTEQDDSFLLAAYATTVEIRVKAEAVEPLAQALLESDAITCDADGVVLSDRLVRAIEDIAEARRALSTTVT